MSLFPIFIEDSILLISNNALVKKASLSHCVQTAGHISIFVAHGNMFFIFSKGLFSPLNCIDETSPFNISKFTLTTNQTNSRVNAAFAKIAIPTTPISQWFDNSDQPYKWFNPPMSRFRKIAVKLRYHNGQLVDFGTFDYSFMLELTILKPQIQTNLNKKIPSFSDSFS